MNFKGLADNFNELFHRKRIRTPSLLTGYCMSSNTPAWRRNIEERVSSIFTDDDDRKMSLERPSRVVIKKRELSRDIKISEHPKKMAKSVNNFSLRAKKPLLPARNNKQADQNGGPKRPGLLRAEPIGLRRPQISIKIKKQKQVRSNSNLRQSEFMWASTSNESSEYYDDRSPVFGGWSSDSFDRNSSAKLCLSILGSIESDHDYGGEEGAKPFATVNNDGYVSNTQSHSEGQGEGKSRRPMWSSDDDDLQERVFFPSHLSPYLDLDYGMHSLMDENKISVNPNYANKNLSECPKDIPPSERLLSKVVKCRGSIIA